MKQSECKGCGEKYTIGKGRNKFYCSRECYRTNGLTGKANPFYGRKHSKETIEKMKGDERCSHKGKDNPFYGKTHSEEAVQLIKEKNKIWRENNKVLRLKRRLEKKGLTRDDLLKHWQNYKNLPVNRDYYKEVLGIDYRTFNKFLVDCEIETEEEIRRISEIKKLFQHGSSISAQEVKLLEILNQEFGKENVEHQAKRFGYWYDFCIFGNILVEYDGYYYHKVLINKNDKIKENLALTNGYKFVRIEEDEARKVDSDREINKIKKAMVE